MAMGLCLSKITLNVTGLISSTKRQRLAEWIQNNTAIYMLSTRDASQNMGQIQTESEGLEKDISHKWRPKENRSSNTDIR